MPSATSTRISRPRLSKSESFIKHATPSANNIVDATTAATAIIATPTPTIASIPPFPNA